MDMKSIVEKIVAERKDNGGINSVFFSACGGSLGALFPAKVLLETESKRLRVGWVTANEFVHTPPAALGPNSVLITASHGGNTPETIEASKTALRAGAAVIGLTYKLDSDLAKNCSYPTGYTFGDNHDIAGEKVMEALKAAVEILHQTEGYENYPLFQDGVAQIDGIVKRAQTQVVKRAAAFAEEYKDDKVIYTMGSGASWSSAYMQCICILMEMQWINASCIHAGEFFHGPFEITDANTPFMIQISEGKTRALDERALRFLKQYGRRYEVFDAKELGLSTIPGEVVDYFNHSLFNNVYTVYNKKLADIRRHPLTTRRYMWKVQY